MSELGEKTKVEIFDDRVHIYVYNGKVQVGYINIQYAEIIDKRLKKLF